MDALGCLHTCSIDWRNAWRGALCGALVSGAIGLFSPHSLGAREFIRGDVNASGKVDIADPVANLVYQFLGTFDLLCRDAADDDDNGLIEVTDPIWSLRRQFLGKASAPALRPEDCGPDPTPDALDCRLHGPCESSTALEGFTWLGLNDQGYPEYRHDLTWMVFVLLPGGTFWRGAQADDPEGPNYDPRAIEGEWPVAEVTLSPFLIAKYEVTQGDWLAVMDENPSTFQPDTPLGEKLPPELHEKERWLDLPVERVSWDDIQLFEEQSGLRLPTEAQWEYACRAGTSSPYAGTGLLDEMGWYVETSEERTHVVGGKLPNQFGLYDMHGNVWEWCEDTWEPSYYLTPEATLPDPLSTRGGRRRIGRGGAWSAYSAGSRSAYRYALDSAYRFAAFGFRPAVWPIE